MKIYYTSRSLAGKNKFGHVIDVPNDGNIMKACVEHRLSFLGWVSTPPPMLFRTYDEQLNTTCEAYVTPSIVEGNPHVSIRIVDSRVENTNDRIAKERTALRRRNNLRIVK